ncbi:MAG TPA: maleylpyruvate isomerase family mycothiol-dependent enzyme, partial [Phycicoccus sp.]|nr:maleylpyruvate isomerase family mycothiol-dependent enzyme [Phycicoccus sp.]
MAALTPQQTREHLRAQTDALIATVTTLDDLEVPSLCAGWSRAHVLTHLARNADGIGNLVRAAAGAPGTMYASDEARDADIEAGAHRAKSEIVDDLLITAHEV